MPIPTLTKYVHTYTLYTHAYPPSTQAYPQGTQRATKDTHTYTCIPISHMVTSIPQCTSTDNHTHRDPPQATHQQPHSPFVYSDSLSTQAYPSCTHTHTHTHHTTYAHPSHHMHVSKHVSRLPHTSSPVYIHAYPLCTPTHHTHAHHAHRNTPGGLERWLRG